MYFRNCTTVCSTAGAASVPIVLKNPLKNSLQSHTAASTNVIYIGLSSAPALLFYLSVQQFLTNITLSHSRLSGLIGTIFHLASHSCVWCRAAEAQQRDSFALNDLSAEHGRRDDRATVKEEKKESVLKRDYYAVQFTDITLQDFWVLEFKYKGVFSQ